jgi:thiamine-monophosphate kinase
VADVASAYGADPLTWVLGGGHDHAFAATFAARKRLPKGFVRIGEVTESSDGGPAVTVDGKVWQAGSGHAHFG